MPFKFNPLTGQLDLVNATSAGTVSSVALADGSSTPIYTISGSPVTSTGTLTFTLNNENANLVFSGPATGSPAQPTFRSLVAADIPSLPYLTSINGNTIQAQLIVAGTGINVSSSAGTTTITNTSPSSGGTVTSVSVVSANGLAGTVATATTTPAITLSTTITGILQGNGTAISAATTGNLTDVGTDGITVTNGTGAVLGSGTSIAQHVADSTHNGYLSSTDWSTFNNKQPAGNYITALTGDATATGPGSVPITFATVNANVGFFGTASSVGSFTVNAKGLLTAASNTSIQITESQVTNLVSDLAAKQSTTLTNTHLLVGNASNVATDVAASGDLTLANTGAFTLNTVNANVGSFGSATATGTFTVNAKGLITAASSTSIQITESQVTNLVTDLAGKQSTTLTNTHILVGNASNVATDVAMSGDATIANTGALTLATVNANVGSFTSANITVNAKGLITAASNGTGGAGVTVVNKSANYTVLSADNGTYFTADTSGAAFTLTLPTPSSGFHIKIKDSTGSFNTNNLTLAPSSTEKIEGLAASKLLQTNWGGWEVFSNGTDWFLI